jgi:hypothetical protein
MLLPELMAGDHKIIGFGRGLGLAAENPRDMWQSMIAQVAMTKNLSVALLAGFLIGLQTRDRALADALLDEAVEDLTLAEWFPVLQAFIDIDEMGLARLHRALALGKAPMNAYYNLACGRSCDAVPGPEFKHLVLAPSMPSQGAIRSR